VGTINIENIEPGMVLAGDAKARNGRVLLRAGKTITEKHIETFKAWGVTEADVEGITKEDLAASAAAQADPKLFEKAERMTRARFRHTDPNHPFVDELQRLCTFRALKMLNGAGS